MNDHCRHLPCCKSTRLPRCHPPSLLPRLWAERHLSRPTVPTNIYLRGPGRHPDPLLAPAPQPPFPCAAGKLRPCLSYGRRRGPKPLSYVVAAKLVPKYSTSPMNTVPTPAAAWTKMADSHSARRITMLRAQSRHTLANGAGGKEKLKPQRSPCGPDRALQAQEHWHTRQRANRAYTPTVMPSVSSVSSRCCISLAAFLVKVTSRTCCAGICHSGPK